MFKHNITAVLNKQRPDKDGRFPLRIRTTIKGKVKYYPTSVMLKRDEWNDQKKEVVKVANRAALNVLIKKKISEIDAGILEGVLLGEDASVVSRGRNLLFKEYAESKIRQAGRTESADTVKHKESYLRKFERFKPGAKLSQITGETLLAFEDHCRGLGNTDNTVWSSTKFALSILNAAAREGVITKKITFNRTRYENPQRVWLTADELDRIEKYISAHPGTVYAKAANWFLFSCYSGLRYGDVRNFTADKIKDGKIILRTAKAGTDVSIKIHPKLKACIARMDFNVTSNQDYNRLLKALAALTNITKPLTSHLGRHTFSVQFLNNGGSMEVLSKILGHTTIKTTAIYGQITDKRIDAEIDKVFR